jgi:hypothetical protein
MSDPPPEWPTSQPESLINGQIPANLFDSKSLTLKNEVEQIGRYLKVTRDQFRRSAKPPQTSACGKPSLDPGDSKRRGD